jgi:hypothetical protein
MKVKTQKAGRGGLTDPRNNNHNQTLVRAQAQTTAGLRPQGTRQGLKVKTQVKAGRGGFSDPRSNNHNQTLVRAQVW